jgi:hypothetical protein
MAILGADTVVVSVPEIHGARSQDRTLEEDLDAFLDSHRARRRSQVGSSLSSGAARRRLQICHEALEDGI